MHLRHIVPALGILASTTGAAFAENVGGLTVGGFVDTIFTYQDDNTAGESPRQIDRDFTAAVELRIGYKATEKVTAQVDVEWNNGVEGRDTYLEQAFVNYAFADQFSITSGKFTTFAGWVSADADGLFRVKYGPIVQLYGSELVGAALNYAPTEALGVSVFVVNGLDVQSDFEEGSLNDNGNDRLGAGVDVVYKAKDIGTFNVEGGYDYLSADDSEISLGANATIKLASYEPLTLGAEVIYRQLTEDLADTDTTWLGALAMANHTIPGAPFPMSGTGMIQYVAEEVEAGGTTTVDGNITEFALALLTNPTGDSHFGLNAEVAYSIESDDLSGADDIKAATVSLEAIAVIP